MKGKGYEKSTLLDRSDTVAGQVFYKSLSNNQSTNRTNKVKLLLVQYDTRYILNQQELYPVGSVG
jgi:hypothetical protein